jgi:hypothetical protein
MRFLSLAVLAVGGLGAGLYLADRPQPDTHTDSEQNGPLSTSGDTGSASHRFPLTAADVKDTLEAATLTTDPGGMVYLAWASRTGDDERTLYLARSSDTGKTFDTPRVVARSGVFKAVSQMKGKTITRELRMVPHLAASADSLHLAWTETLPANVGVRMVTATSTDRGRTFGPAQTVHHGADARATFTALTAAGNGALLASWLDNRNSSQQCFAAIRGPGQSEFTPEQLVHAGDDSHGVCPCCPTASLLGPDGTAYVAFRNVAAGYRDIAIGVKSATSSTYVLHPVVPPSWAFNGCPHDGPSLALVGDTLHVVWMDARSGVQRCYHAHANIADMKFESRELHAAGGGTQGNAKLVVDSTKTLHAVWEATLGSEPASADTTHQHGPPKVGGTGGRAIMHAVLLPGQSVFTGAKAIAPKEGAFQTRPTLAVAQNGNLLVAWNELDTAGKAVVFRVIPPPSPSCCRE